MHEKGYGFGLGERQEETRLALTISQFSGTVLCTISRA